MGVGFNEGLYRPSSPWFLTHLSLLVFVLGTVFYVCVRNANTAQCLEKGRQTCIFKVKGTGEQQSLRCKCLKRNYIGRSCKESWEQLFRNVAWQFVISSNLLTDCNLN